jgi:hypothetical protein
VRDCCGGAHGVAAQLPKDYHGQPAINTPKAFCEEVIRILNVLAGLNGCGGTSKIMRINRSFDSINSNGQKFGSTARCAFRMVWVFDRDFPDPQSEVEVWRAQWSSEAAALAHDPGTLITWVVNGTKTSLATSTTLFTPFLRKDWHADLHTTWKPIGGIDPNRWLPP